MPYYLVHAGDTLQKMDTDGTLTDIALPGGVTLSSERPARFALLNRTLLVGNAPSRTLLFDGGLTAHLAALSAPSSAPTVAAGAGALTGDYFCAYSYAIKDAEGNIIVESDLSPISAVQTLAAQGLALSAIGLSSDATVTTRRIYRSASGGDTLYWAADIDDNLTATYLSAESDAALGTESVANYGLGACPGGTGDDILKLLVTWKDRVWGVSDIVPDNLRFSGPRMPYAWSADNYIGIPLVGEDTIGVNGFLPRRDELGVLKLNRVCKIVGSTPDDFQLIVVQEGIGCYAPDSCIVIRDVGYFLSHDGVYAWGPEGVYSISDENVRAWFTTGDYFNRSLFSTAFARYNWRTHSYELHLPSAGQETIDRWVQYDIARKRWFGPHRTLAFTPASGGQIQDVSGLPVPAVGSADGYLWTQDATDYMDGNYEIPFSVVTQPFSMQLADRHKLYHELSLLNRQVDMGFVEITPTVDADQQNMFLSPLTQSRTRLRRIGNGRLMTLQFEHDQFEAECELYAFEIPYTITGRR